MACRSQWLRGLRRGSAAAQLLGLWVRIHPGAWMSVSCECHVLSGSGVCGGAGHSSRGALPSVVCLSVIVNPWQWGGLGPLGAVAPRKKKHGRFEPLPPPELLTKLCQCYVLYARRQQYSGYPETLVNIYQAMASYAKNTAILIMNIHQNNKTGLCLIHIKKWQFVT
jgi:hypothetical protein